MCEAVENMMKTRERKGEEVGQKRGEEIGRKRGRIFLSFALIFCLLTGVVQSGAAVSAYNVPDNMKWWAEDKFGMFIHFGSYSEYGQGEWAMQTQGISKEKYQETISAKFNPTQFDAKEIVSYAKKAGMKYLVFTAKHHEGLAMWDTKVASFKDHTGQKIFSLQQYTPFGSTGRDIIMELKNACDEAGIKFGLYYSIIDWNHSSQTIKGNFTQMKSWDARTSYINDMKAQLKELVDTYDPAVMWFDGDWTYRKDAPTLSQWWTKADGEDLYQYVKSLKQSIIVNERVCRGFGLGDFECPEQNIPEKALSRSWETCQTMNGAWGYNKNCEKAYYDVRYMVQDLVEVASKDGNYLLNIGPKGNGAVTAGTQKVLSGIGTWIKKNGESIYGSSGTPFQKKPSWGRYTRKENKVYAHVIKWPKNQKLVAAKLKNKKLQKVSLLQNGKALKYSVKNNKITIKVPKKCPDKSDTVISLEYK